MNRLEKDLAAAQKTVDTLKTKMQAFLDGTAATQFQKRLESSLKRAEHAVRKQELAEMKSRELKLYSERLEGEVRERTKAITDIIENVQSGFLIIDKDCLVKEGATKSCLGLFEAEVNAGGCLCELLHMSQREKEHFQAFVDQVFENILPPDITLRELPTKFKMRSGKVLQMHGEAVFSDIGDISGILFTINDITALEKAQAENALNKILIKILRSKESFQIFTAETASLIKQARDRIQETAHVKRIIHTLKGNFASYDLEEMVSTIHQIEERKDFSWDALQTIESGFENFLEAHANILGIRYGSDDEGSFHISSSKLLELKTILSKSHENLEHIDALKKWTSALVQKPASSMIGPMEQFVKKLSSRLGKKVSFRTSGLETLVDYETMRPIFGVVTHLIRNSVDHGVEKPGERILKGKDELATVQLELVDVGEHYRLDVFDDGRGINEALLLTRAVENQLISTEVATKMSRKEILNLVFMDHLSTANVVTDISGRGVGMSAVLNEVQKSYGTILINSLPGKGTRFTLLIPKPEVLGHASGI